MELQTALALRGFTASTAEVKKMMAEANKKYGRAEDTDSQVSLEAFKAIVKKVCSFSLPVYFFVSDSNVNHTHTHAHILREGDSSTPTCGSDSKTSFNLKRG